MIIHSGSIFAGMVIPISGILKCLLRCRITWKYHCVAFSDSRANDFFASEKFFQQLCTNASATPLGVNDNFHYQDRVLMLTKRNNGQRCLAFINDLTPEIFSDNKTVFLCPIFIKIAEALVQTRGFNSMRIKPIFDIPHCVGIVITPHIIRRIICHCNRPPCKFKLRTIY